MEAPIMGIKLEIRNLIPLTETPSNDTAIIFLTVSIPEKRLADMLRTIVTVLLTALMSLGVLRDSLKENAIERQIKHPMKSTRPPFITADITSVIPRTKLLYTSALAGFPEKDTIRVKIGT